MNRCNLFRGVVVLGLSLAGCASAPVSKSAIAPNDHAHTATVHVSDFSKRPGPEWSSDFIGTTPKTASPFLGQFCNDTVSLKLRALPPHEFVRLSFKLYVINTWDGIAQQNGSSRIGPDFWSLDVGDGRNLIRTTLSNTPAVSGFHPAAKYQCYPAPIPSQPVLLGTGADSQNELGYIYTFKGANVSFPMDSVYTIDVTIPHAANDVEFDFTGAELQGLADEGWAIADVHVQAIGATDVPKIAPDQFSHLFNDAATGDPVAANRAFWKLASNGDATAEYLAKNVSTLGINTTTAMKAATQLPLNPLHDHRLERSQLCSMGPAAELFLSNTNLGTLDPKSIERKIAEEIVVRPVESTLRRRGAVAARLLQVIGTPRSAAVIKSLIAASADDLPQPEDWMLAFAPQYSLPKGAVLKYIAPPLPPERENYWPREQRYGNRLAGDIDADIRPMPSQMILHVFDEDVDLTSGAVPIYWRPNVKGERKPADGISEIVHQLGLTWNRGTLTNPKIVCPPELEHGFNLPGDWLVRFRAKPVAILAALEPILKEQTGRTIRFGKVDPTDNSITVSEEGVAPPAVEMPAATQPSIEPAVEKPASEKAPVEKPAGDLPVLER